MSDSIFSKIIRGEIPSYKVWENEKFFAFLDINPRTNGHTLVVPKEGNDYIFDLSSQDYAELWEAVREVADKLKRVLACQRVCVGVYGYEIAHVHVHLFPTNAEGDLPLPPVNAEAKAMLEEIAALLRP